MVNENRLIDIVKRAREWNELLEAYYPNMPCQMLGEFLLAAPAVYAVEVPPIKIGDTAYFIINKQIYEAEICLISWSQFRRTGVINELRGEVQKYHTVSARFSDWGKSVFATKQEAEAALAKMDGERREEE